MEDAPDRKQLEHDPDAMDEHGDRTEYDVVKLHNESAIDSMTELQKKRVSRFYELLANAMPLEGRDYRVEFEPGDDGKAVYARINGINDLGKAFSAQVSYFWKKFGRADYDISNERWTRQE